MLNNFAFSFSGNGILLFFLLLIAIVFSIFIYRRTNPIVPTFLRLLLTTIRAATLLLLIFIVFETILNFRFEKNNPPILAIAVDNSASMSITDSDGARPEIIKNVLSDDFTNRLADKFDLKYYTFSSDIKSFSPQRGDTLNFLGDATNISSSLEKIKADNVVENLTNILLISDGNYNDGGNPVRYAEELNVPIYTIGIGSDEPMMDIAIIDVNANPFTYAKQSTPIQITVRNTGYNRINVPIELEQDGQNIERQTIELAAAPSEKTVTLNYMPSTVGRQKLDLSIPAQSGEHLTENNKRSFYIDVFKSKLNILLIAGAVSPDISFIKRILQNDRYDVQSLIHKKNGQFYEEPPTVEKLKDVDIYIFLDFPMRGLNQAFKQNLLSAIESKKQPILLIPGISTSVADLNQFTEYTPWQTASQLPGEEQISVEVSPLGASHPIMQVTSDPVLSQTIWRQLPPVSTAFYMNQLSPGSEVLAYARSERQPNRVTSLIAIKTNGAQKSAAIFATQLWRWDFMMRGINRSEDVYTHVLQNIIRWLETNRSDSLVRVKMDKTQYRYGDPIDMRIEVYDENLNSVENVDVQIKMQRESETQDFSAQPSGQGNYNALIQAPQPGDYKAVVSASLDGRTLGKETILFSVGEYSAELTDIQSRPAVLQSLSRATGGKFVSADSSTQLLKAMHGEQTITSMSIENELWNNKIILFLILFLLTLEWFIRKRRGMV